MGYGVMAYTVDIDRLRELCGSGDDRMRRAICGRYRQQIAALNDGFGLSNERGEPSVFTAVGDLVMGRDKPLDGYVYGYAFKYIVEFFGRFLDNSPFYPCPSTYLADTVDPALAATGAQLSMADLIFRGAPVTFPAPDDFPAIGYWTAGEVAAGAPILAGSVVEDPRGELRTVSSWLDQGMTAGRGIVGFYH